MMSLSQTARLMVQSMFALASGLLIASALLFGVMALAIFGFMIGCAGAILAHLRKPNASAHAYVTLQAHPTGRGWRVDPSSGR